MNMSCEFCGGARYASRSVARVRYLSFASIQDGAIREAVLRIELTDETNQVAVLSMTVSENQFHTLKSEEGIRVDFNEFPAEFIELMKACQETAGSQTYPR